MFFSVFAVALLAEGVDRNFLDVLCIFDKPVALLAEGVDRNLVGDDGDVLAGKVALLAEGVDRNKEAEPCSALVISRPPRGGRG